MGLIKEVELTVDEKDQYKNEKFMPKLILFFPNFCRNLNFVFEFQNLIDAIDPVFWVFVMLIVITGKRKFKWNVKNGIRTHALSDQYLKLAP